MGDWQTVVNMYWQYLLVAGVIGLVIGWFFTWLSKRGQRKGFEASLDQAQSKSRSVQKDLDEARKQADSLKADLRNSEANLSKVQSELTGLQEEKAAMESRLEERVEAVTLLEGELTESQTAAVVESETLEADINALQGSLEALTAEKQALQERWEVTQADLAQMKALVEVSAKALSDKETALGEAYTRAVVLQRDVQSREKMLVTAQGELDILKADVMALESQKQELEDKLHRARGDVAGEMALVTSTMLKMKEDSLSQANARIAQLTQELESLRANARGGSAAASLARSAGTGE